MKNFDDRTPALQIKEWFMKEYDSEIFNEDEEFIILDDFAAAKSIEKSKKLFKEDN